MLPAVSDFRHSIQPGRGFEQAAVVLGTEYDGFLVRDGWIVYRGFSQAIHQTCLAHLLRLCRNLLVAGQFHADIDPSGRLIAIMTPTTLNICRLPEGCVAD